MERERERERVCILISLSVTDHSSIPDERQSLGHSVNSSWNETEVIFADGFLSHVECTVVGCHALGLSTITTRATYDTR